MCNAKERIDAVFQRRQRRAELEQGKVDADRTARAAKMDEAKMFLAEQVEPAFNDLKEAFKDHSAKVTWDGGDLDRHLRITFKDGTQIAYSIAVSVSTHAAIPQKAFTTPSSQHKAPFIPKYGGIASPVPERSDQQMDLSNVTKDTIKEDFLKEFESYMENPKTGGH